MDRNVVIATVLIMGILLVWMTVFQPPPAPVDAPVEDTVAVEEEPVSEVRTAAIDLAADTFIVTQGAERLIAVETDLYRAQLSTKGATLVSFELKEYNKFDQLTPVQLVDSLGPGALGMEFQTPGGRNLDTRGLFFETDAGSEAIHLASGEGLLGFETPIAEGVLRVEYSFAAGSYEIGLSVQQTGVESYQTQDGYELVWSGAIPFSEDPGNRKEEISKIGAYARSGSDVDGITLQGDEEAETTLRGDVSWMAVKNKYFGVAVLADGPTQALEAELYGLRVGRTDDPDVDVEFRASLFMPRPGAAPDTYRLFMGPLEYRELREYEDLYEIVDYGWDAFEWMTRPLATLVFIPVFSLLSNFIPNYGLVIILFGFLIKVALYPLTKSSYKSMAKMRELQPKMQEIKEKYPDDPQKQQTATMKLYRESGTNPLGSCLPMLLQYPIIIALWQFLQQSIEIRQEGFLWANDLSAPDAILNLPFSIPFYGDFVAGFTVLMGLSMIVQMRMQAMPATGMQAKIFMYVMPGIIFVVFNRLPSGLSLYYLVYNVVTAAQQKLINVSIEKAKKEAPPIRKVKPSVRRGKPMPSAKRRR